MAVQGRERKSRVVQGQWCRQSTIRLGGVGARAGTGDLGAGQDRAEQSRAEQSRAGQGRAGQGKEGQGKAGKRGLLRRVMH